MPRFAANLSMLFTEVDFLDRFDAAATAGFSGVEYLFPYDFAAEVIKARLDANRLEQELIYYIEKIDISEELVRLNNHCDYFFSILAEPDPAKGKKLGFILQEIGREINTTGSKANDAEIQKSVVLMKDELEKAKEQVLNIL